MEHHYICRLVINTHIYAAEAFLFGETGLLVCLNECNFL